MKSNFIAVAMLAALAFAGNADATSTKYQCWAYGAHGPQLHVQARRRILHRQRPPVEGLRILPAPGVEQRATEDVVGQPLFRDHRRAQEMRWLSSSVLALVFGIAGL